MPISLADKVEKFKTLLEMMSLINSTLDYDWLLQSIVQAVKKVMDVEASSLILYDPDKDELYFSKFEGGSQKVKEIRFPAHYGIAGHVWQTGKPLIVNDVEKSPYFYSEVDRKTYFKTRSVMAAPLISRQKVIGVIEAVNKTQGDFDDDDLSLFLPFADQIRITLENTKLYNMAFRDGLTGLFDRRYFDTWIDTEYSRVKRYQTDLSLIMLDIDHFKKINDQYGHQGGDYVLRELAATLKNNIRRSDVVARYGGEEFIIALPETKLSKAELTAEKIRKAVAAKKFEYQGKSIKVTVSSGVTSFFIAPEDAVESFIKDADQALYQSKQHGRNCVTIYEKAQKLRKVS